MSGDTTRAGGRDGGGDGGAAHALPHGASHWDRIPRELHDGILDAAGPLTRLTASNPHPAEVRCMSRQDRERLWADVVELDWQGNLAVLPPVLSHSVLLGVRSRSLLQRLFEQRIVFKETHQRIAIRNGWHDLLDVNDKDMLAYVAAKEGDLDLLKHLVEERKLNMNDIRFLIEALSEGRLDIFKYLHAKYPDLALPSAISLIAAQSGSLECLLWVRDALGQPLMSQTLAAACQGNQESLVKFLLDQPGMDLDYAIRVSAERGHIRFLDLLFERFLEKRSLLNQDYFIGISDLAVFKWLHKNNIVFDHDCALYNAVERDRLDSVRWLCSAFDLELSQDMLETACQQCGVSMIKFMLGRPEVKITESVVEAAAFSSVNSLDLLLVREPHMAKVAADTAAATDCADVLDWLHTRYPGCITQSTLAAAVKDRSKSVVEYLLETVHDVEWELEAIKQIETSDEVAGLIDRHMNSRR
ncbi:hypothetical protein HK105_208168 [Polyrhizophydium stewartii]|uniref:Ankyrin repeat protein n=1 Tax=Polyrhizophydium stewartii TaxID=2732419 RepID=A0ABR4MYH9_9FUNG